MGFFSDVNIFNEQNTDSGKTKKEPLGGISDEDISDFIAEMQEDEDEWDDDDEEYGNDSDEVFDEYDDPEDHLGDDYFDDGDFNDNDSEEDELKGNAPESDIDFIDEPMRREVTERFIKKPNPAKPKIPEPAKPKNPEKKSTPKPDKQPDESEKKSVIELQETTIAQDTELVGTGMLICQTNLAVGGIFSQQELQCRHIIRVGETGTVKAKQISCESILVMGNVECSEKIAAKTVEILEGGCVTGNIECTKIIVNKSGRVIGQISALENITVLGGAVNGNLASEKKIKIEKGSFIKGNISSPEIIIGEGARILGTCNYTDNGVDDFFNGDGAKHPRPKTENKQKKTEGTDK